MLFQFVLLFWFICGEEAMERFPGIVNQPMQNSWQFLETSRLPNIAATKTCKNLSSLLPPEKLFTNSSNRCTGKLFPPAEQMAYGVNPFSALTWNMERKLYGKILEFDCETTVDSLFYLGMLIPEGYNLIRNFGKDRDSISQFCDTNGHIDLSRIQNLHQASPGFIDALEALRDSDIYQGNYWSLVFAYLKSERFCIESTSGLTLTTEFQLAVDDLPYIWDGSEYLLFLEIWGLGVQQKSCYGGDGIVKMFRAGQVDCYNDSVGNPKNASLFKYMTNWSLDHGYCKKVSTERFSRGRDQVSTWFEDVKKNPKILSFDQITPLYKIIEPIDPIKAAHIKRATRIQIAHDLTRKAIFLFKTMTGMNTRHSKFFAEMESVKYATCISDDYFNWVVGYTGEFVA